MKSKQETPSESTYDMHFAFQSQLGEIKVCLRYEEKL